MYQAKDKTVRDKVRAEMKEKLNPGFNMTAD